MKLKLNIWLLFSFNNDPSIDVLLLTTHVGGLGLNLTGADTVIFVEHDWNPMKDLQVINYQVYFVIEAILCYMNQYEWLLSLITSKMQNGSMIRVYITFLFRVSLLLLHWDDLIGFACFVVRLITFLARRVFQIRLYVYIYIYVVGSRATYREDLARDPKTTLWFSADVKIKWSLLDHSKVR